MTRQYPRWKKLLAESVAVFGIVMAGAGAFVTGQVTLLLATRTPKAIEDWVAIVFLGVILVLFLVCIAISLWMLYRMLRVRAT